MSQVFSGDSVNGATSFSVPGAAETVVVTGHFLSPPFQNAKAIVMGNVILVTGTGTTQVWLTIRRNPNAENAIVYANSPVTAVAGNIYSWSIAGADAIPDGRPVQYALTLIVTGATANSTVELSNISVLLISG